MSIYPAAYKKNINRLIKRNIYWFSLNACRFCDSLRDFLCIPTARLVANCNFHNYYTTIILN